MATETVCAICGERIPPGESECPECAAQGPGLQLRRDWLLMSIVMSIAAVLFVITYAVTDFYNGRQQKLARVWYDRGDAELRAAHHQQAVSDLGTALAYSRESFPVRLRLAQALLGANRQSQAEAYLRALWEEQPGNATVNVELARLAVAHGDAPDALRYYHGAIYGVWDKDPVQQRRQTRLELIEFLLRQHELQEAESELIALLPDLPGDPKELVRIAGHFLEAGDPGRALEQYALALRMDPLNQAALRGAAQAALQDRRYAEARRLARAALKLDPGDTRAREALRVLERVLELDPSPTHLSLGQRAERIGRAAELAQYRLESCATQKGTRLSASGSETPPGPLATDYAQLLSLKPRLRVDVFRREPDLIEAAMQLVYRSEADAQQQCGGASPADQALLLLGGRRGGTP